jgi:hypothetical protein
MTKKERRVDVELRDRGGFGCEVQFLFNGELAYGRLCPTRADAMVEAESKRRECESKGWMRWQAKSDRPTGQYPPKHPPKHIRRYRCDMH